MENNNYGIWIGEDSTIAIVENLKIVFLRLKEDLIASILYYNSGVVGVTYGYGNKSIGIAHTQTKTAFYDGENKLVKNNEEAEELIKLHSADIISYDEENEKLVYKTYDNRIFKNFLAEKIEMNIFERSNEIDNSISIVEKMARWNIKAYYNLNTKQIGAGIDTRKYSIFYTVDLNGNQYDNNYKEFIYCRVGLQGYCEKGWAMLPTIQIRHYHTSMLADNLASIQEYQPNEEWFVEDSCAFPADGGWYWTEKEVTDGVIYLNGCGGVVYEIHRR